jgi:hypothetical protein
VWDAGAQACGCLPEALARVAAAQVGAEARFEELLIDAAGKAYVLTFSAPGLGPARSFVFGVVPGQANHLAVAAQPRGGTGGVGLSNAPVVAVHDAGGNLVISAAAGAAAAIQVTLQDAWLPAESGACAAAGGGGNNATGLSSCVVPPPPPPRTKWTRRVPHPVLIGHAASLTPY